MAAAREAGSGHEHVIAAGAHYFASPDVGQARIETQVLRAGRTAAQVTAVISSQGRLAVQARFTLTTLPAASKPYWGGVEPVTLPPIGECYAPGRPGRRGITISFDPRAGTQTAGSSCSPPSSPPCGIRQKARPAEPRALPELPQPG